ALWPSIATGTTWWSSASAASTAAVTASASASGPALQKRCRTPQPTVGTRGSGMAPRVPVPDPGPSVGPTGDRLDQVVLDGIEELDDHDGVVVGHQRGGFPLLGGASDQDVALGPVDLEGPRREPHHAEPALEGAGVARQPDPVPVQGTERGGVG